MAARDLQNQFQTLVAVNPASGKTGLEKWFQVSAEHRVDVTPLYNNDVRKSYSIGIMSIISQKLQTTVHCRQVKTFSTLPVNRLKNRYTDSHMLPCEYIVHYITTPHAHTHSLAHKDTHTLTPSVTDTHTHTHTHTHSLTHTHTHVHTNSLSVPPLSLIHTH